MRMSRRKFLAGCGAVLTVGCSRKATSLTPIITTASGPVQGEIVDGVHRFLGIPYAEAPFGENRWRPPVRRQPWRSLLPATRYGPICPQTGGIQSGLPDEGEDCLNLNIWTPDPGANNLPVMVWAHGGGQVSGAGSNELYDGTHFAREGVVLITCNRRLGAEGYLYLEELFGDGFGSGNLGIQDLIFVLKWVQENVARFGGDPGNVTLFGESGGGAAAQAVIATPGSEGLVNRVIPQSGGHAAQRTDTATMVARTLLKSLGVRSGDRDSLRAIPWRSFVEAYELLDEQQFGNPQIYLPVINQHMPVHPVDTGHLGIGAEVDYLIGTCRDEANLFSALLPSMVDGIFHHRAAQVVEKSGRDWADVVSAYTRSLPHLDQDEVFNRILGDMWFRVPSLKIAAGRAQQARGNTYVYQFEWESPLIGAAHALDLMVFGNGLPFEALAGFSDYQKTADFMRQSWVRFAATGDPSIPGFSWPGYTTDRAIVGINETLSVRYGLPSELAPLAGVINGNWLALDL